MAWSERVALAAECSQPSDRQTRNMVTSCHGVVVCVRLSTVTTQ